MNFRSNFIFALLLSCSAFAQDINTYQPTFPFTNNYVSRSGSVNLENCTGASACWFLSESSGSVIDSVASLTLTVYNAANTYNVSGLAGYTPGITMNPVAGGFAKNSASAALEFGTGDGNVFIVERIDGVQGAANVNEHFCSTIVETAATGWSFRLPNSKTAMFTLIATDSTPVTAIWGNGTNDAIFNAHTDNLFHRYEIRIDRTGATVTLLMDGTSFGPVSIAPALNGKTINSTGVCLGQDYRAAINRNVPITVMFARVKKSVQ